MTRCVCQYVWFVRVAGESCGNLHTAVLRQRVGLRLIVRVLKTSVMICTVEVIKNNG